MAIHQDNAGADTTSEQEHIPAALLAWFATYGRDLPWRRTRDPYHILVSEMMLQQTQVDRVLPKYLAFLESFPTLAALAEASTAAVIRAWAGLGYNRRAINLQRTARTLVEAHAGIFPRELTALRQLPGIGPYTAGAIACFAFEQDVAFMDTNIRRVIQRAFVGPEDEHPSNEAHLLHHAHNAIPAGQGWAWNQAIMELGALICTATAPACWRCPIRTHCRAYAAQRSRDEQLFDTPSTPPVIRPRRIAERRETPFLGSNRYYRGRIIDLLRRQPHGHALAIDELGPLLKETFAETDRDWLQNLLEGLARDGLITLTATTAHLPS